ncbi:hypothetical protein NPIL_272431, partial [Nephila pilipes]
KYHFTYKHSQAPPNKLMPAYTQSLAANRSIASTHQSTNPRSRSPLLLPA